MTAPTEPGTCPGCYLPPQYRTRDRCDWCPALDRPHPKKKTDPMSTTAAWLAAVAAAGLSEPAALDMAAVLASATPAGDTLLLDPPNIAELAAATGRDRQLVRQAASEIVARGLVVAERPADHVGPTPLRLVTVPNGGGAA